MAPIVVFKQQARNHPAGTNSQGTLKAQLFDLADQDRAALAEIRDRLELQSNALAVRLAIRYLARHLSESGSLAEKETVRRVPDGGREVVPPTREV